MDLMSLMQVESLGGKRYAFIFVDDFSWFTWVNFIKEKYDVLEVFKDLRQRIQREKESEILRIQSDHGKEFENNGFVMSAPLKVLGMSYPFLSPHNITTLWNARTELSKSHPESCFMPSIFPIIFG